jgi:hypothetical protein
LPPVFWILPVAFTLIGVLLFVSAFVELRKQREIQDTPLAKTSSAAIGPVALEGIATATTLSTAPAAGVECILAYEEAYRWEHDSNDDVSSGSWSHVTDILWPPAPAFTLTDDTGKIVVQARGAAFMLQGNEYFSSKDSLTADFVTALKLHGVDWAGHRERNRIVEHVLRQGDRVYVYGTAAEASQLESAVGDGTPLAPEQLAVWSGKRAGNFFVSQKGQKGLARQLGRTALVLVIIGPILALIGIGIAIAMSHAF